MRKCVHAIGALEGIITCSGGLFRAPEPYIKCFINMSMYTFYDVLQFEEPKFSFIIWNIIHFNKSRTINRTIRPKS